MNRKEIKVGDKYAVVYSTGSHARRSAVAATVLDLNADYIEPPTYGWGNRKGTPRTGGIRVRFDEPMVNEYDSFEPLAALKERFNDEAYANARTRAVTEYVFRRGTGARHILAPWDKIVSERQAAADLQARHARETQARAADFAPVLDAYMAKLGNLLGVAVALHDDKSGIYLPGGHSLSVSLDVRRIDGKAYVVGFAHKRMTLDRELFDKLVGIDDVR